MEADRPATLLEAAPDLAAQPDESSRLGGRSLVYENRELRPASTLEQTEVLLSARLASQADIVE